MNTLQTLYPTGFYTDTVQIMNREKFATFSAHISAIFISVISSKASELKYKG